MIGSRCAVLFAAIGTALLAASVQARTFEVAAGQPVQPVLEASAAGDTVALGAGVHEGPLRVERAVVLRGAPGAVVDGGDRATVIEVAGAAARIEDLAIRGSGDRALTIDSGIHLVLAHGAVVRNVTMADVLYGIYVERAHGARIEDCRLTGRVKPLEGTGEGNGVHLWYANDVTIAGNDIARFLDGIYLSFAHRTEVRGARLHDNGRYGLHTMYCQQNLLTSNLFTRNVAGCAIMFSNHLRIENNDVVRNRGPRTYGFLLRDCSDGRFTGNRMVDNTIAVFMDNSNRNHLAGNLIQDNGWGLLMYSSCDGNEVAGNSFINNDYPVALDMRRTSNRFDDGARGNYWSGSAPFDLDGDGLGDAPYSPVGAFAFLSKQYPDLAILARSPAVTALGVAERVVPALRPSEVVDRRPLLEPVAVRGAGAVGPSAGGAEPAWGALVLFTLIAAIGAGGLWRGRRVRA